MTLKPTNVLLVALRAVADEQVVCHPAWSHHVPGWGWAMGGDVALNLQHALSDLLHARLVEVVAASRFRVDGDPVVLTAPGRVRLAEWNARVARVAS